MIKALITASVGTSSLRLKLPGTQLRSLPGAKCLGRGPLLALTTAPTPSRVHKHPLHLQTSNLMWTLPEARLQRMGNFSLAQSKSSGASGDPSQPGVVSLALTHRHQSRRSTGVPFKCWLRQQDSDPPTGCSLRDGAWQAGRAIVRCPVINPATQERPKPTNGGGLVCVTCGPKRRLSKRRTSSTYVQVALTSHVPCAYHHRALSLDTGPMPPPVESDKRVRQTPGLLERGL